MLICLWTRRSRCSRPTNQIYHVATPAEPKLCMTEQSERLNAFDSVETSLEVLRASSIHCSTVVFIVRATQTLDVSMGWVHHE